MTSGQQAEEVSKHDAGQGEEMKSRQGLCQSLLVSGRATEACGAGKTAFDHPSARQQNQTAFGLGMLSDFQLNSMLFGSRGSPFPRVPP